MYTHRDTQQEVSGRSIQFIKGDFSWFSNSNYCVGKLCTHMHVHVYCYALLLHFHGYRTGLTTTLTECRLDN